MRAYVDLERRLREEALPVWQERLRLRDWQIELQVVKAYKIGRSRTAEVRFLYCKKQAGIYIICPEDCDPDFATPYDPEYSLIHELVHIHFVPQGIEPGTEKETQEEIAVDAIAGALLNLGRVLTDIAPEVKA